jgi:hypothetical protein
LTDVPESVLNSAGSAFDVDASGAVDDRSPPSFDDPLGVCAAPLRRAMSRNLRMPLRRGVAVNSEVDTYCPL